MLNICVTYVNQMFNTCLINICIIHMLFYMLNVSTLFIWMYVKHVLKIRKHFSCDIQLNSQKIVISLIRGSDSIRWRVLSVEPMYCCGRLVSKSTTNSTKSTGYKWQQPNTFKNPEGSSHHTPFPHPGAHDGGYFMQRA